jgi:hypothetical protein
VAPAKTKKAPAIKTKSRKKAVMHDQADNEYVAPAKKMKTTMTAKGEVPKHFQGHIRKPDWLIQHKKSGPYDLYSFE